MNSLSISNYNSERLLPLLGQYGNSEAEQWIFPSLRFTCSGRLTQWIFRAASPQNTILSRQCRISIATWRLDASSSRTTYTRHTSTAGRLRRITNNNSIITYELASPVQVEPDDIVGIELQTDSRCSLSNTGPGNILSLDLSSTDKISQSYRHFVIDSNFRATYLVPFIQPVIGKIMHVVFPLWFGIGNGSHLYAVLIEKAQQRLKISIYSFLQKLLLIQKQ